MTTLDRNAIRAIQNAGFSVYQRDPHDSYAYFTDGENIGYIQYDYFGGYELSTVHIPNKSTGTGFNLYKGLTLVELTKNKLREAFILAPHWGRESYSVKKYRNMEHFLSSDSWNAGFKLLPND